MFAQAFKELGFIAQSKFGLTPDQFGDIFLYDGNATTSASLGNTLFADTKGGTVIDSSHAEYGNIAVNAAGGVKTDLINTLGHETIEAFTLRTGGANDAAQEAQARAFGTQLADRINQAAGGTLDSTGGSTFSASLQSSYAVTQGTIRTNYVGNAQVDHRRLRVAETETLERTRAAINDNTSLAPEKKEIAQLQLNALACSAVKCANGVPKDDPLYGQLLALQSAGETLNQQGISLDSILGEDAGGQFEHGLKARFDDLLTSQDETVVRTAGAGQAVAGALGMVGGVAMGAASAAGCAPSAGLSCAGVVAGSAITVLSLEQGRTGLDTVFGAYHHTEGQAVSNSFTTEGHQGDHNPSLDLAIDAGIAATELLTAKLGTKYLEKALDGKVVRGESADFDSSKDIESVPGRRAYLNEKYGRTGDLNTDINIRGNRELATNFYLDQGWHPKRVESHVAGIDFSKPVDIFTLPTGRPVSQYQVGGNGVGNYFAPVGTRAEQLGINPSGRETLIYAPTERVQVLRSTAAEIVDTWSVPNVPYSAEGGGTQYFTSDPDKFRVIINNE